MVDRELTKRQMPKMDTCRQRPVALPPIGSQKEYNVGYNTIKRDADFDAPDHTAPTLREQPSRARARPHSIAP
jgi:hypothetical protein